MNLKLNGPTIRIIKINKLRIINMINIMVSKNIGLIMDRRVLKDILNMEKKMEGGLNGIKMEIKM